MMEYACNEINRIDAMLSAACPWGVRMSDGTVNRPSQAFHLTTLIIKDLYVARGLLYQGANAVTQDERELTQRLHEVKGE